MQIPSNCTSILDDYGLLYDTKQLGVMPERMMNDAIDGSELTSLYLRDLTAPCCRQRIDRRRLIGLRSQGSMYDLWQSEPHAGTER